MDARMELERRYADRMVESFHMRRWVSPTGQKDAPFLRWFRYKEAYSPILVEWALDNLHRSGAVLDPFCGRGTTLLTCARRGIKSYGVDISPLAHLLSLVATTAPLLSPGSLRSRLDDLLDTAASIQPAPIPDDVPLLNRAFDPETLVELRRLWAAVNTLPEAEQGVWAALVLSTVDKTSFSSKDGAYVRLVHDRQVLKPAQALRQAVEWAEFDLSQASSAGWMSAWQQPEVHLGDARRVSALVDGQVATICNSPPYPNRYDYSSIYMLELALGFFESNDGIKALRRQTIRSHVGFTRPKVSPPPHPAIQSVYDSWEERGVRLNNDQVRPMLAAYFEDMESAVQDWRRVIRPGGNVVLVVGNVTFAGETVPSDLILCDIAERNGFRAETVHVARYKGNSSQQMGVYKRIPVRESVLVWSAC